MTAIKIVDSSAGDIGAMRSAVRKMSGHVPHDEAANATPA
jgi:hypothetical protein